MLIDIGLLPASEEACGKANADGMLANLEAGRSVKRDASSSCHGHQGELLNGICS